MVSLAMNLLTFAIICDVISFLLASENVALISESFIPSANEILNFWWVSSEMEKSRGWPTSPNDMPMLGRWSARYW